MDWWIIKAVTLDAVSAWAIMTGVRRLVDRTRKTNYRGRLAIHAGQLTDAEKPVREKLTTIGVEVPEDVVRGAILGAAELVNVIEPRSRDAALWGLNLEPIVEGPYCWVLVNPRRLSAPVTHKGRAGVWDADVDWKSPAKGCLYCGEITNRTRDHVPPSAIFPRKPKGAITVPACERCNQEHSKDDVYFRDVLVAHQEAADCPEAHEVQQAAMRSFADPRQAKYTGRFFSRVKLINVTTPAGLLLPRQPALVPESDRLERVVARVVRGLFYHEFADRIPDNYEIHSFCVTDRLRERRAETRGFIREVFPVFNWSPIRVVGPGAFAYRFTLMPGHLYTSMWLLAFYEKVHFYGCVMAKGAVFGNSLIRRGSCGRPLP